MATGSLSQEPWELVGIRDITGKSKSSEKKTLLVICNYTEKIAKIIEIFDLDNQEWVDFKFNECDMTSFTTVLLDHQLMLISGFSNVIISYNLKSGKIKQLPSMKHYRRESSVVKFNDEIFVFGGFDGRIQQCVEKFNPTSKKWTEVTQMTIPRASFATGILGNEIFITGGYGGSKYETYLYSTEAYDPVNDKWRNCAPMNEKRYGAAGAVIGDYFYVVGGFDGDSCLNTAERYDPKTDKWTFINSFELHRQFLAAANFNGQLVIAGGKEKYYNLVSIVQIYDEISNSWKSMPSLKNLHSQLSLLEIPWNLAKDILSRRAS